MKKNMWQKYLSLLLSFAIVFNITMVPVFADENDSKDAQSQEEQVEGESSPEDDASAEDPSDATEEPAEETEQEPSADEQEGEQPSEDAGQEPAEEEPAEAEPSEEPAEAPEETEPEEHVGGEGQYVKNVYISYAKTEEEAKEWLREHKWEPLNGSADFNAGKASLFDNNELQDQNVAAVMGIRRTDKASEAITDMAVMNMKGGYSFPDYQSLLKEKKTEINEYINSFIPVLEEYRKNYSGKGSDAGKKRAELAHEILNKFYDGGADEPYALNDTGKPLGDLFLDKVMQEGNKKGGDLEQMILESSGPALTAFEISLALAADAGENTWLERLQELSGDELAENLEKYVPEASGQDTAPSAVTKFLKQHFGDTAKQLAAQWNSVHERMLWLEQYNSDHDLWKHDNESDEDYKKRIGKYFDELDKKTEEGMGAEHESYIRAYALYTGLYETPYEGEWGATLGDFFNPAEGDGYSEDTESFLTFAAALSEGQRASADQLSLETLLMLGMGTEESIKDLFPQVDKIFDGADTISIYSGINRGIYRGGVALTDAALMEKNQSGNDPFSDMWNFSGIYNITVYAAAIAGVVTIGAGLGYLTYVKHTEEYVDIISEMAKAQDRVKTYKHSLELTVNLREELKGAGEFWERSVLDLESEAEETTRRLNNAQEKLKGYQSQASSMTSGARVLMGVGGALLVGAAVAKGYQLYRYYNKTFTQIPMYIVDEADIVSYEKDDEGNETKLINFDQYVYYQVVRCNRQEAGEIGDRQDGVSDYVSWGCGDAADLNADMGQQWLALYAVKSERKGYPILADSLKLQYGSDKMPEGTTRALHMFAHENAADLGDTAYSYNNDKNGVYFFWAVDEKAFEENDAASTFAGGSAAIAGGLGLLIGILGTAIVMRTKKKKGA